MRRQLFVVLILLLAVAGMRVEAIESLVWRVKEDRVDAQIEDWTLKQLLPRIARATGWRVYVEPGTQYTVSAKFKNQPSNEALKRLLGRTSFSVVRTNNIVQLYIYNTKASAATELVAGDSGKDPKDYLLGNELVIRLKKGSKTSIEELARQVGAKIVGRDDALGIYRLQFESVEAAQAAKESLMNNSDVAWVDSNYLVDPPNPAGLLLEGTTTAASNIKKDVNPCSPTIGLVDTALHTQSAYTNFLLPSLSVVGDVSAGSEITHADGMVAAMASSSTNVMPKILPVVVYKNGTSTTTFEVAQGIAALLTNGVSVINLSLGGTGDSGFLKQLIEEAQKQGIVFVAAAGNEPVSSATYPAAWPGVIAVTASDSNGRLAEYANYGDFVKAMASGSSYATYNGQVWRFDGTSVAAAKVSGMVGSLAGTDCVSANSIVNQVVSGLPMKK